MRGLCRLAAFSVLALTSCGWRSASPASTPTAAPLTLQALSNAEYNINTHYPPVLLKDGAFDQRGQAGYRSVHLVAPVAFGDLDGDGIDDAAAILTESFGGSGTFYYLAAVLDRAGQPIYIDAADLGDRIKALALSIDSGTIHVDLLVQGPGQGLCCPNLPISEQYQLQANRLTKIRTSGSSSAAPILASHQP